MSERVVAVARRRAGPLRLAGHQDFWTLIRLAREEARPGEPVDVREEGGREALLATVWSDGGIDFTPQARHYRTARRSL